MSIWYSNIPFHAPNWVSQDPTQPGTPPSTVDGYIKAWFSSSWNVKPVKAWSGSAWQVKPLKYWNGSAWITTSYPI